MHKLFLEGDSLAKNKYDKELEKTLEELREYNQKRKKEKNELLNFFIGLIMFGAGLFLILQNIRVTSSWGGGYFYHIGSWGVPNGLIVVPLIIGVFMLFIMDRKIFGWIVCVLGIVFILASVIMSVQIRWLHSSGYAFILMFGLVASGGGLMLKALFKSK